MLWLGVAANGSRMFLEATQISKSATLWSSAISTDIYVDIFAFLCY